MEIKEMASFFIIVVSFVIFHFILDQLHFARKSKRLRVHGRTQLELKG